VISHSSSRARRPPSILAIIIMGKTKVESSAKKPSSSGRAAMSKTKKAKGEQKRTNGGAMKNTFRLSDDLAKLTGFDKASRAKITKAVHAYIKEHNLQVNEG